MERKWIVDGIEYKYCVDAIQSPKANPYKLSKDVVKSRLKRGMSLEQALHQPPGQIPNAKKCVVDGVMYESVAAAIRSQEANKYHLAKKTVEKRIGRGETIQQALSRPSEGYSQATPCIVNGVQYESFRSAVRDNAANPNGLYASTIRRRIRISKYSIDDSFAVPSGCLHKKSDKWEMAIKESKIKKGKNI